MAAQRLRHRPTASGRRPPAPRPPGPAAPCGPRSYRARRTAFRRRGPYRLGPAEGRLRGHDLDVVALLLDGPDQEALDVVVALVPERHDGAGGDHVARMPLEDLGVLQQALDLADPGLHLPLVVLGRVVVAV